MPVTPILPARTETFSDFLCPPRISPRSTLLPVNAGERKREREKLHACCSALVLSWCPHLVRHVVTLKVTAGRCFFLLCVCPWLLHAAKRFGEPNTHGGVGSGGSGTTGSRSGMCSSFVAYVKCSNIFLQRPILLFLSGWAYKKASNLSNCESSN